MFRKVIVRSDLQFIELIQLNHQMTKTPEGLEVEVGIRMRYVDKLGHGSRVHLNMFLSHCYFVCCYSLFGRGVKVTQLHQKRHALGQDCFVAHRYVSR